MERFAIGSNNRAHMNLNKRGWGHKEKVCLITNGVPGALGNTESY